MIRVYTACTSTTWGLISWVSRSYGRSICVSVSAYGCYEISFLRTLTIGLRLYTSYVTVYPRLLETPYLCDKKWPVNSFRHYDHL
jgi:hypothetical protein